MAATSPTVLFQKASSISEKYEIIRKPVDLLAGIKTSEISLEE
jgi:hypothetical protein